MFNKLLMIQTELNKVDKGGTNDFNKYKYARLGDVLDALRPYLAIHKFVITQTYELKENGVEWTDKGHYSHATVIVITKLTDVETGEVITNSTPGFALDKNSDKALYKAMTGARKYGIVSMFNLDWDAQDPENDGEDEAEVVQTKRTTRRKVF
jgi:hypothetical protein